MADIKANALPTATPALTDKLFGIGSSQEYQAAISDIASVILTSYTNSSLGTSSKNIVGAINELNGKSTIQMRNCTLDGTKKHATLRLSGTTSVLHISWYQGTSNTGGKIDMVRCTHSSGACNWTPIGRELSDTDLSYSLSGDSNLDFVIQNNKDTTVYIVIYTYKGDMLGDFVLSA